MVVEMRKPDWPAMVGSSSKVKVVKVAPIEKVQLLQAGTQRQLEARVDERGREGRRGTDLCVAQVRRYELEPSAADLTSYPWVHWWALYTVRRRGSE